MGLKNRLPAGFADWQHWRRVMRAVFELPVIFIVVFRWRTLGIAYRESDHWRRVANENQKGASPCGP